MNIGNYIRAGNTLFGNYGSARSYVSQRQRINAWREHQNSYHFTGSAADIILDETILSIEELHELVDKTINKQKRDSYIMPTKTDLMEFLQEGDEINNDTKLGTSRYR